GSRLPQADGARRPLPSGTPSTAARREGVSHRLIRRRHGGRPARKPLGLGKGSPPRPGRPPPLLGRERPDDPPLLGPRLSRPPRRKAPLGPVPTPPRPSPEPWLINSLCPGAGSWNAPTESVITRRSLQGVKPDTM